MKTILLVLSLVLLSGCVTVKPVQPITRQQLVSNMVAEMIYCWDRGYLDQCQCYKNLLNKPCSE